MSDTVKPTNTPDPTPKQTSPQPIESTSEKQFDPMNLDNPVTRDLLEHLRPVIKKLAERDRESN